ncbi:hypothetical protein Pan216_17210 [Planctomycetes bacterium Pan216]|uniref:Uncharacterized protein n=1 Tax=Kolteria novifilia TaxID=2527975 RepID=A0A518B1L8_9BACT|nr:hypothetical protein Pan216_17210 [Planctomycetes bacterium Pan216]
MSSLDGLNASTLLGSSAVRPVSGESGFSSTLADHGRNVAFLARLDSHLVEMYQMAFVSLASRPDSLQFVFATLIHSSIAGLLHRRVDQDERRRRLREVFDEILSGKEVTRDELMRILRDAMGEYTPEFPKREEANDDSSDERANQEEPKRSDSDSDERPMLDLVV